VDRLLLVDYWTLGPHAQEPPTARQLIVGLDQVVQFDFNSSRSSSVNNCWVMAMTSPQ
jgi:hypothetical protein